MVACAQPEDHQLLTADGSGQICCSRPSPAVADCQLLTADGSGQICCIIDAAAASC